MDEYVFNFSICSLVPFFFKNLFVQLNTLELNYDKADIHRHLEEYQSYTLGYELVRG